MGRITSRQHALDFRREAEALGGGSGNGTPLFGVGERFFLARGTSAAAQNAGGKSGGFRLRHDFNAT